MMKNLKDPRLPIAVLRAAILDTFVALSDKWIFEVCCHASSQWLESLPETGLTSTPYSYIIVVKFSDVCKENLESLTK